MRPLEYELVDMLSGEGVGEEELEAIRILLSFIGRLRSQERAEAKEGEIERLRHDLERSMDREHRFLNALMLITGLREGAAVNIAAEALYGHRHKRGGPASAGEAGTATDSEAGVAEGEHAVPQGDAQKVVP